MCKNNMMPYPQSKFCIYQFPFDFWGIGTRDLVLTWNLGLRLDNFFVP